MQRHPNVIPLNDPADIRNNAERINEWFFFGDFNDYPYAPQIKTTLEQFMTANGITLSHDNLQAEEKKTLLQIIEQELKKHEFNKIEFERQLSTWMSQLKNAVAGQGEFVAMHVAHSSGMAADLINHGSVSQGKWGTDLDIKQCLGRDLTYPDQIIQAGSYILPPVSLTQDVTFLRAILIEVADAIKRNQITGNVDLRIPVNCGDQHWRLAKIVMNNGAIISASLWDSLSGNQRDVKQTLAFQNFTKIVGQVPELQLSGIQHNGYSCMDYVIQETYRDAGFTNQITQAENAEELRFAVVKQIAENHANIRELADNLMMNNAGEIEFNGEAQERQTISINPEVEKEVNIFFNRFSNIAEAKTLTEEDKNWQVTFDEVLAEHLQELYDANPHVTYESNLIAEARRRAIRELGFFPPVAKHAKPEFTPDSNHNPANNRKG